jgi:hypothetical protein
MKGYIFNPRLKFLANENLYIYLYTLKGKG